MGPKETIVVCDRCSKCHLESTIVHDFNNAPPLPIELDHRLELAKTAAHGAGLIASDGWKFARAFLAAYDAVKKFDDEQAEVAAAKRVALDSSDPDDFAAALTKAFK